VDGILKNSQIYKSIESKEVGQRILFRPGKHTGTQTIMHLLGQRGYEANEEELKEILQKVKERKMANGKAEIHRMAKRWDPITKALSVSRYRHSGYRKRGSQEGCLKDIRIRSSRNIRRKKRGEYDAVDVDFVLLPDPPLLFSFQS